MIRSFMLAVFASLFVHALCRWLQQWVPISNNGCERVGTIVGMAVYCTFGMNHE